ncbi:hypothetical protein ACFSTD_03990 [Novosphingobium colocasiae]
MALATHLYGVREGYRPLRPGLARWAHVMVLENALLAGLGLIGIAALGLGAIALRWSVGGFAALPSVLPLTLAAATGALGVQTLMGGFLLAIIGGHDARFVAAPVQTASSGRVRGLVAHLRRSPRYTAVAVACFVLHNAIMIGLDHLGFHYALCLVGSAVVLTPAGYVLQSRFTFRETMRWASFLPLWCRAGNQLSGVAGGPVVAARCAGIANDARRADRRCGAVFFWNYATSSWALATSRRNATLAAGAAAHG